MINVNNKTSFGKTKEASSRTNNNAVDFVSTIDNWHLVVYQNAWHPPTDIFETEEAIIVRIEIAGMDKSGFSINLDQDHLTVRGSRMDTAAHGAFYQMEIHTGQFCVKVKLPGLLSISSTTAEYQDGFLTVILPKA